MRSEQMISNMARDAGRAARSVAKLSTERKNRLLESMAEALAAERELIRRENDRDLTAGRKKGLSAAMLDRLALSDRVMGSMMDGLREIASLPDPVGEITEMVRRPSGIVVGRMRVPLGVIAMIYESRPNVTVDAAALCLKAGNSVLLRGGSEAIQSNLVLARVLRDCFRREGVDDTAVQVVPVTDRQAMSDLLHLDDHIDLVIPRCGEGLIRFVAETSRIPVLKHYKGVCHIYVDADADLEMASRVIMNAKTQRPGVCNALETLLVHADVAPRLLPALGRELSGAGVEVRGCSRTTDLVSTALPAGEDDFGTEFLNLILAVRVVDDLDSAMEHIARHGSRHTESIITSSYQRAQRFLREVDASAVMVNASTRFADGAEFGLGAEIGISTTKLHAYGPMGLRELTTRKFVVYGDGQIRG